MLYTYFGSTGLRMSRIAFGVQTFGWSVEEETAFKMLGCYADHGGNYIDLADSYNEGRAEEITGKWLKNNPVRDDLIIGSKVFFSTGSGENDSGLSRKHILSSLENSLRRLNTDYIDLYQVHCFDGMTPLEEVVLTMDILVRSGKIRYYGLSNFTPSQVVKSIFSSEKAGYCPPASLQFEYSLLVRSAEWELLPVCMENNLGLLAWSPLAGGWLTGKYRRGEALPEDSRAGQGDRWDDNEQQRGGERTYAIIDTLLDIAGRTNYPVSRISLAWMLEKQPSVVPLIGARRPEQLEDNLKAVDVRLSEEDFRKLEEISSPGLPYPYGFIDRYTRRSLKTAGGTNV